MSKEYRRETRHTVTVAGRYRARQGGARDVWIKDISEYGCRFFDKFSVLQTEAGILVKVGNVGPIPADVKWRKGHVVGAEFEQPLHPSVLEHIIREMDQGEEKTSGVPMFSHRPGTSAWATGKHLGFSLQPRLALKRSLG